MKTRTLLQYLAATFTIMVLPLAGFAQTLDPASLAGDWTGSLAVPGQNLPIVFHLVLADGTLSATWDSPNQGAMGLATKSVVVTGSSIEIDIPMVRGGYSGMVEPGGTIIRGEWKQGGASFSLDLARGVVVTGPKRPQTPSAPFPYKSIEVTIPGGTEGVALAGTLTVPAGAGPFPALILVSGSGPQDRDETLMGHKPFLVVADYLTRCGIAVLRYDDRGFGASTGNFAVGTTMDFAADAQAALDWLSARSEIDPARVGIAGHSEGGLIAPIVASRDEKVRFLVLLAGPGMRGSELLYLQSAAIARASGASETQIAEANAINAKLYAAAIVPGSADEASARVKAVFAEAMEARKDMDAEARRKAIAEFDSQADAVSTPWMRGFLALDPSPYLAKVSVPTLALNGSLDLQVPVAENLKAIAKNFAASGRESLLTVQSLEGLNHLFQHATMGLPTEYASIEETFAPEALAIIAQWVNALPR